MSLWPISELIQHAREHQYALGYFERWNLESLQGVLDAAEATASPIIIGFNGDFLSDPNRKVRERIRCYAELGKAGAADASVPCGLIFNECPNDDWVRSAVLAGFNLVCRLLLEKKKKVSVCLRTSTSECTCCATSRIGADPSNS